MKQIHFYICPDCGDLQVSIGTPQMSCCGKILSPLTAKQADDTHKLLIEDRGHDYYVTSTHEMKRTHYIQFITYVTYDKVIMTRLYPGKNMEVHIPNKGKGTFYFCCSQHGLWVTS